jgi:nicotinamide mononucleotide transporter
MTKWKPFEIIWLISFTLINIYLYYAWQDTPVGLLASITGMLCVVLAARGSIFNYYPGIINVILYAYVSYQRQYYGEVMLNLLYFLPMQFWGLYLWGKKENIDAVNKEIVKIQVLSNKNRAALILVSAISTVLYGISLKLIKGSMPFVDSASTILSIVAMYLMAKRYLEQWFLWIIIDVVTIIMWFAVLLKGHNDISMLVMWSAYLVNAIYGFFNWIKLYDLQKIEAEKI